MSRFHGRTVVVTGAAQGMGEAHARGFHAEGANVVVADVQEDLGRALAADLGDRAIFVPLDVSEEDSWARAVSEVEDRFGRISVLVNNAAVSEPYVPIIDTPPDVWRRTIDVNLVGTALGIRAVAPSMRDGGEGSIVNISSVGGYFGMPRHTAYTASKWGVRGLTKAAAVELGRYNIRVNSVFPGSTLTPMMRKNNVSGQIVKNFAIPRSAEPDEITRMVMFVASDEASFSTGSEFIVDGGLLLSVASAHNAHVEYE